MSQIAIRVSRTEPASDSYDNNLPTPSYDGVFGADSYDAVPPAPSYDLVQTSPSFDALVDGQPGLGHSRIAPLAG